ncbi:MAG: RluA family pseudouridine synthase [Clostridiales bacterium]|jgi:23S rRNA pseudouridine1911/1915/1917 synthase|nr:RluA family pseudouridine synthase [Clostridiales bacterium]
MIYKITENGDGLKIKEYLRQKGYSYTAVKRLKKYKGQLTVGGVPAYADFLLKNGDILEISEAETNASSVTPIDMPLVIVYEDEYLLMIDKPPYLATLPTKKHYNNSLANGVAAYMQRNGVQDFIFRAINRLDADTSGLLAVAKKNFVQHALQGKIKKTYFLAADGIIENAGEITLPISDDKELKKRRVCDGGAESCTRYTPVKYGKAMTGVLAEAVTGRTHQLRVHFAAIGHSIVGDTKYGKPSADITRQALHSYRMEFLHPITGEAMDIVCKVREDIEKLF